MAFKRKTSSGTYRFYANSGKRISAKRYNAIRKAKETRRVRSEIRARIEKEKITGSFRAVYRKKYFGRWRYYDHLGKRISKAAFLEQRKERVTPSPSPPPPPPSPFPPLPASPVQIIEDYGTTVYVEINNTLVALDLVDDETLIEFQSPFGGFLGTWKEWMERNIFRQLRKLGDEFYSSSDVSKSGESPHGWRIGLGGVEVSIKGISHSHIVLRI